MIINEIFHSLQGEGKLSGLPTVFVRCTGCNLRCSYCDTSYAYFEGNELSTDEIIQKIKDYKCHCVCITGGEPLLQEGVYTLIASLNDLNYDISIETNGSKSLSRLVEFQKIMISLDIKCPSSEMHEYNELKNLSFLRKSDQLKFIIKTKNDFSYAASLILKYKPLCKIFFQPIWGIDIRKVADWLLASGLNARLGIQLHKIIWGDQVRR